VHIQSAIDIPRHHHDLLWQLSADVEAFLIEARSVYELLGKFLRHFCLLIFQREVTQKDIISAVRELGVDVSWFSVLKDNRDLFVHSAASLLAVERISTDPPEFDLILLKRTVEVLDDKDFIRFRDLRAVQKELSKSVTKVATWIENEISAVEAEEDDLLDAIESGTNTRDSRTLRMQANEIIVKDEEILGGSPVFRGTRVPFQALLDYLEGGQTLDEFLDDFPTVSKEAAVGALELAKSLLVDQLG
jgi:uncharacterized protein (DUF433 family)